MQIELAARALPWNDLIDGLQFETDLKRVVHTMVLANIREEHEFQPRLRRVKRGQVSLVL